MNYPKARDFIIEKLSNELAPDLTYHSIDHTLDVLNSARNLAELEKVSEHERLLLETAALYHDSDLDYLGREDFFMIAHQLQYEWNVLNIRHTTLREWYELQIMFLENHGFFTQSAQRLRNEKKEDNLKQVKELVCFMNK